MLRRNLVSPNIFLLTQLDTVCKNSLQMCCCSLIFSWMVYFLSSPTLCLPNVHRKNSRLRRLLDRTYLLLVKTFTCARMLKYTKQANKNRQTTKFVSMYVSIVNYLKSCLFEFSLLSHFLYIIDCQRSL